MSHSNIWAFGEFKRRTYVFLHFLFLLSCAAKSKFGSLPPPQPQYAITIKLCVRIAEKKTPAVASVRPSRPSSVRGRLIREISVRFHKLAAAAAPAALRRCPLGSRQTRKSPRVRWKLHTWGTRGDPSPLVSRPPLSRSRCWHSFVANGVRSAPRMTRDGTKGDPLCDATGGPHWRPSFL